jgi:hypothetical protein
LTLVENRVPVNAVCILLEPFLHLFQGNLKLSQDLNFNRNLKEQRIWVY